jgi:glycosyltransferase involved in cell wall biosynthesis
MALRKPVVASRAGGVPEIITDGESGVLYSPGDHSQLAEEILKLLKNPGQATALGEAGYKRLVDEFSIEKHVSQIQQLYETIFQKS